jgi:hypothetical protein
LSSGNKYVGQGIQIEHNNPAVCVEERSLKGRPQLILKRDIEYRFCVKNVNGDQ